MKFYEEERIVIQKRTTDGKEEYLPFLVSTSFWGLMTHTVSIVLRDEEDYRFKFYDRGWSATFPSTPSTAHETPDLALKAAREFIEWERNGGSTLTVI